MIFRINYYHHICTSTTTSTGNLKKISYLIVQIIFSLCIFLSSSYDINSSFSTASVLYQHQHQQLYYHNQNQNQQRSLIDTISIMNNNNLSLSSSSLSSSLSTLNAIRRKKMRSSSSSNSKSKNNKNNISSLASTFDSMMRQKMKRRRSSSNNNNNNNKSNANVAVRNTMMNMIRGGMIMTQQDTESAMHAGADDDDDNGTTIGTNDDDDDVNVVEVDNDNDNGTLLESFKKNIRVTQSKPHEKMKRVVMKFGGSSLANAERIIHVADLIKSQISKGYQPMIVCSAMGKTTNNLLNSGTFAMKDGSICIDAVRTLHMNTIQELGLPKSTSDMVEKILLEYENLLSGVSCLRELTPRTLDYLVSFGERMSIRIMAARLNQIGVPAQHFDSWTLGLRTTSEFGNSEILPESYETVRKNVEKLDDAVVAVVTGFIGKTNDDKITTLGRGGSDLTASFLAAANQFDEIQVWKDVNGIMTADPKVVPEARPVPAVSFEEASELAYFGAKVLHPISMLPAMRANIPVRVKNSYNPDHPGTVIQSENSASLVTAITSKKNIDLIDIVSTRMLGQHGFLSKVFRTFEEHKISVDCVATSEVSLSLTLDPKHPVEAKALLKKDLSEIANVKIQKNRSIISLISNVKKSSEVMAIIFETLRNENIRVEMISQGASKVNISLIVDGEDTEKCIAVLHNAFFGSGEEQEE